MKNFYIEGPTKIKGEVKISGSKNSALPIIFSSLLIKNQLNIENIPKIKDIKTTLLILKKIGVKSKFNKSLFLDTKNIKPLSYPCNLITKIRASIWIISPLLINFNKLKINMPGGCNIGKRPINLHINILKLLGYKIKINKKKSIYIYNYNKKKIKNDIKIKIPKISVGATITSILLTVLKKNQITTIENIAKEPEIIDTINFLNKMGAKIKILNKKRIKILGVKNLHGGTYKIIPDRIETSTFLISSTISKSKIICYKTNPYLLKNIINKLILCGAKIKIGNDFIKLNMKNKKPKSINIYTSPYPGTPTDIQTMFTLLNILSKGNSTITETIFKNRFTHIKELKKMGAKIKKKKNKILCKGVKFLKGTNIKAKDLRSAICLTIAGCLAYGKTIIKSINHIDRGYENIEKKLINLGCKIKRI